MVLFLLNMINSKFCICFFFFLFLLSCDRLDDINNRLDRLENSDNKTEESLPQILSIRFLSENNPKDLIEDINGFIIGDSIIEFWTDYIIEKKNLIPSISYVGDSIKIADKVFIGEIGCINFNQPIPVIIYKADKSKEYTLYFHSFTGLPRVYIETENRDEIVSKEVYLNGHFRLVEDITMDDSNYILESSVQIKGRGNTTWRQYGDKKPYRLKFTERISILDSPKDKSYILLVSVQKCDRVI